MLAARARAAGYRCASIQMDGFENVAWWEPFRKAMVLEGIMPGAWFTHAERASEVPVNAHFVVAEVESESDRQGAIRAAPLLPAGMPKAILMNGMAFTDAQGVPMPGHAAPLIDQGWKCLLECYRHETTDYPPSMGELARKLGWPKWQYVFGVHNAPLSHFAPWMTGGWGVYLGEYIL